MSRNEGKNFTDRDIQKLDVIYQSGNELLRLINDVLDLSKIEAGKMPVHFTSFPVQDLTDEFHGMFDSIAREKGLKFIIENEISEKLISDRDKLSQIIRNLLSNAFKFTKKGKVELKFYETGGQEYPVKISVSDTGAGIPEDKHEKIFEAFHQIDGTVSRQFGGSGLGLSIAKDMAALIGGIISVESEEGKGSIFTLSLKKDMENFRQMSISIKEVLPVKPGNGSIKDDRDNIGETDEVILIIDDDEIFAENAAEVVWRMGKKALIALNGKDGLSLIRKYRPKGVFLDLTLPDIDGFEILREVKSTRELKNIPIQIISGRQIEDKYEKNGAVGYLQKPVEPELLEKSIVQLLQLSNTGLKNILLVEDHKEQREAIKELLSGLYGKIFEASSEDEAILLIRNNNIHLTIIDLGLEKGDGFEICKYIKEKGIAVPVIIYTGKDLTEQQGKNLKKYAESIIIKTVNSDERLLKESRYFLDRSLPEGKLGYSRFQGIFNL